MIKKILISIIISLSFNQEIIGEGLSGQELIDYVIIDRESKPLKNIQLL